MESKEQEQERASEYMVPVKISKDLTCAYCQGYLSCGPIKMTNQKYVCGRCSPEEDNAVSLRILEIAMSEYVFPCKYDKQGCNHKVLFNHNQEHESKCIHRNVPCPVPKCSKQVSAFEVYDHIQNSHTYCIINNNQFELNLLSDKSECLLIFENDNAALIEYNFSAVSKILNYKVVPIGENNQIDKCKLQIINGTDPENNMNPPMESLNLSRYIDINNYFPNLVFIKIFLSYYETHDYEETAKKIIRKSFCVGCKRIYHKCKCEESYDLSNVTIPCLWKGCKQMCSKQEILIHEKKCTFKLYNCPFCSELLLWNSCLDHLKTHGEYCSNPDEIIIPIAKCGNYYTLANHAIVKIQWDAYNLSLTSSSTCSVKVNFGHEHCRLLLYGIEATCETFETFGYRQPYFPKNTDCFIKNPPTHAILQIKPC